MNVPRMALSPSRADALLKTQPPGDTLESIIDEYDEYEGVHGEDPFHPPRTRCESKDEKGPAHDTCSDAGKISSHLEFASGVEPYDVALHGTTPPHYGHMEHDLSTIFEVTTPPGSQSKLEVVPPPSRYAEVDSPSPDSVTGLIMPQPSGPAPSFSATSPTLEPPRFYQGPLYDSPCNKSLTSEDYSSSSNEVANGLSQTPSTRILFAREASSGGRFKEHFDRQTTDEDMLRFNENTQHVNPHNIDVGTHLARSSTPPCESSSHQERKTALMAISHSASQRRAQRQLQQKSSVPDSLSSMISSKKKSVAEAEIPREWSNGSIRRKKLTIRNVSPYGDASQSLNTPASDSEYSTCDSGDSDDGFVRCKNTSLAPPVSTYSPITDGFSPVPPPFQPSTTTVRANLRGLTQLLDSSKDVRRPRMSIRPISQSSSLEIPSTLDAMQSGAHTKYSIQNCYDVLDHIGEDDISQASLREKGEPRPSYESWTTIDRIESQEPGSKPRRLSGMLNPVFGIGSGVRRSHDVLKKTQDERESQTTCPHQAGLGISFDTLDKAAIQTPAPTAKSAIYAPREYGRSDPLSQSRGPKNPFQPAPAPWRPLPESFAQYGQGSPRPVGHKAHEQSYLSGTSNTPSCMEPTNDTSRQSGGMVGRFPSPKAPNFIQSNEEVRPAKLASDLPDDIPLNDIRRPKKIADPIYTVSRLSLGHSGESPHESIQDYNKKMIERSEHWHHFPVNTVKTYYTNGKEIFHRSTEGSRERLIVDPRPDPQFPVQQSSYGSSEQKGGERFAWVALGCISVFPFLIPLYIAGAFDNTFIRITKNDWSVPNQRQKLFATRMTWVWGFIIVVALIAIICGVSRASTDKNE